MKNKNINEILNASKEYYQDNVGNRIQYYKSLAMKNLDVSKNNFYKIADCGSGYSLFIPFLSDFIKQSNLYMVDDFKSLEKFHSSNEITKGTKYPTKSAIMNIINKITRSYEKIYENCEDLEESDKFINIYVQANDIFNMDKKIDYINKE